MRQSLTVVVLAALVALARPCLRAAVGPDSRGGTRRPRQRDLGRHQLRAHPLVHALSPPHGRRRGFRGGRQVRRAEGAGVRARGRARHPPEEPARPSWSPRLGELTLTEPYVRRLAFTPEVALSLADYSRPTESGRRGADRRRRRDGRGRLCGQRRRRQSGAGDRIACDRHERGRLEARRAWPPLLHDPAPRSAGPGAVDADPVQNPEKTKDGTFAFVLSQREGLRLRGELAAAKTPYKVKGRVDSSLSRAVLAGHRRGRHQGHGDPRPGHRPDGAPAGGALLGQRRCQRVRQRAGDRSRDEADD